MIFHGYLRKDVLEDWQRLSNLFLSANFLIVPSLAECFGVVFVEAAAFAVPSLASDVGGISSAIQHGKTGFLLPLDAGGVDYADMMEPFLKDTVRYAELRQSTISTYQQEMRWPVRGQNLIALMERLIRSSIR